MPLSKINNNSTEGVITSGTAVASTSGTSIDFTSIPSWVKRITVMFNGVSLNASSHIITQIGGSSVETTSYDSCCSFTGASSGSTPTTTGFVVNPSNSAQDLFYGTIVLSLLDISTNTWVSSVAGCINQNGGWYGITGGGRKAISGSLQRIRITTVAGTPTFDAGSINILYE